MATRKKVLRKKISSKVTRKTSRRVSSVSSSSQGPSYVGVLYGVFSVFILFLLVVVGLRVFQAKHTIGSITKEAASTSHVTELKKSQGNSTTYTVEEGDNLWKISEKVYKDGYKWVEIARANKLENPGVIEKGTKLTLPQISIKEVAAATAQMTNAPPLPSMSPSVGAAKIVASSYTVQKGDDLWDIAVRSYGDGYKWVEIARANSLENPNLIHSGNILKLPRG